MIFSYAQTLKVIGCFICMFKVSKIYIIELSVLVRFVNFKYTVVHSAEGTTCTLKFIIVACIMTCSTLSALAQKHSILSLCGNFEQVFV